MAGHEDEDEAPERRRLAEQGNTDAKLFVPSDSNDNDELSEDVPEDAEGGPEGGEAA